MKSLESVKVDDQELSDGTLIVVNQYQLESVFDELNFYKRALRWRTFDETPEEVDSLHVQVMDQITTSGGYYIENGLFKYGACFEDISHTPEAMKEIGYTGWRPEPGDLDEEFKKISKDKKF